MKIRKAKLEEVTEVKKWLVDTAKWLKDKDIYQWERFLSFEKTEVCLEDYYNDKLYVLENQKGNIIGSLSYGEAEDIDTKLWSEYDNSYFIHRIIVSKDFRGMKNGEIIINWAKELAINNDKDLRLNCVEGNSFLYNYYSNQGFKYCGKKMGYHLFKI